MLLYQTGAIPGPLPAAEGDLFQPSVAAEAENDGRLGEGKKKKKKKRRRSVCCAACNSCRAKKFYYSGANVGHELYQNRCSPGPCAQLENYISPAEKKEKEKKKKSAFCCLSPQTSERLIKKLFASLKGLLSHGCRDLADCSTFNSVYRTTNRIPVRKHRKQAGVASCGVT